MTHHAAPESSLSFFCGRAALHVFENQDDLGRRTAEELAGDILQTASNRPVVLWLMAAPSAFPFYEAFLARVRQDPELRRALTRTHFFQFDDYPIARGTPRFPATFRHLLETRFYQPLAAACETPLAFHPLELRGDAGDAAVQRRYTEELLALREQGARLLQLKGTGMDGHWGFHGAETPLASPAGMITVPMTGQNVRQQMLDWPGLFPTPDQVPQNAVTFNVAMFLMADRIIDNTPQPQKEYAVLAAYGTETILDAIPSSALKQHPRAEVFLTRAAAQALLDFRASRARDPRGMLDASTHQRLRALWRDPTDPEGEAAHVAVMETVLATLGMTETPAAVRTAAGAKQG